MLFAPSIPLQFDDTYGYQNAQDKREVVRFHLTNLILTNPGEKITDSKYGVGLRQYLFENATIQTFSNIESTIKRQVRKYLSYLNLSGVTVRSSQDNPQLINVKLYYTVNSLRIQDILDIEVNLESGTTIFAGASY